MATGLLIELESEYENTGGRVDDDEWSRDSSRTTNNLGEVTALDAKESLAYSLKNGDFPNCDLVVGAEVEPGDIVYIVWAEYTTGDSFGTDYGQYELIAAFVDEEKAKKCAKACKDFEENQNSTYLDSDRYSLKVELDNGQTYTVHVPWTGYFESLERVHVTTKTIKAK
jgi:hypothetical protein